MKQVDGPHMLNAYELEEANLRHNLIDESMLSTVRTEMTTATIGLRGWRTNNNRDKSLKEGHHILRTNAQIDNSASSHHHLQQKHHPIPPTTSPRKCHIKILTPRKGETILLCTRERCKNR